MCGGDFLSCILKGRVMWEREQDHTHTDNRQGYDTKTPSLFLNMEQVSYITFVTHYTSRVVVCPTPLPRFISLSLPPKFSLLISHLTLH